MVKVLVSDVFLLLFILSTHSLLGQSEWDHSLVRGDSHDLAIYENTAYVATRSGLLEVNMDTH